MTQAITAAASRLEPFDGPGASDARVFVDRRAGTTCSEKWGGESWFALSRRPRRGELQRWYLRDDGRLEHDLVLQHRPRSNVFSWRFDCSAGLEILHQPWLADRERRPADVCNSYALYHHQCNNQYQTGKLAHVYRPLISDAKGRWAWGRLLIEDGTLSITVPPGWLARAVYPVVVDPTIGYTSIGASTDTTESYSLSVVHQAGEAGDANPGTAYYGGFSSSGTITDYVGVYTYNASGPFGQARLAASSGISITTGTGAFRSAAITWTGILASTNYFITAWSHNANTRTYYDSGGATGWYRECLVDAPPATFPDSTNSGAFNNRVSAYVDFTGSGGGGGHPAVRRMGGMPFTLGPYRHVQGIKGW